MKEVLQALSATTGVVVFAIIGAAFLAAFALGFYKTWEARSKVPDGVLQEHSLRLIGLRATTLWGVLALLYLGAKFFVWIDFVLLAEIVGWISLGLLWLLLISHFIWGVRAARTGAIPELFRYGRYICIWSGIAIVAVGLASYKSMIGSNHAVERTAK